MVTQIWPGNVFVCALALIIACQRDATGNIILNHNGTMLEKVSQLWPGNVFASASTLILKKWYWTYHFELKQ